MSLAYVLFSCRDVFHIGLVSEDPQVILKAFAAKEAPSRLLVPFHAYWRPGHIAVFVILVSVFGVDSVGLRCVQVGLVLLLGLIGWHFFRRRGTDCPWMAAMICMLWLVSPLTSETICGSLIQIGALVPFAAELGALLARRPRITWTDALLQSILVIVAASLREDWIMLVPAFFLQDVLVFEMPLVRAARRSVPWVTAAVGYVLLYGWMTGFHGASFYATPLNTVLYKLVTTIASFFHTLLPVAWQFAPHVKAHPMASAASLVLLALLLCGLLVLRHRRGIFFLACSGLLLLPTLPSDAQAARYTFLPFYFFLAACALALEDAGRKTSQTSVVRVAGVVLFSTLAARDYLIVQGDIEDWSRYASITRRLEMEVDPLLGDARKGLVLVVLRHNDGKPLLDLLNSPRGQTKYYFPRPDDPYGLISLSALLSLRTYHEGFVMERVSEIPSGRVAVAYAHESGGFRRMQSIPGFPIRHPDHSQSGWPGVILVPRPATGFDPRGFP